MKLYLPGGRKITQAEHDTFKKLILRRSKREPLQYILGTTTFCDLELLVDKRALIPRPETEELVEAIKNYYALAAAPPRSILDLGTGSGAIILSLGKIFPRASLTASDLDAAALSLARNNEKHCRMEGRTIFCQSDWFQALNGMWNLIVSNPPYLSDKELESAQPEVRLHEPHKALIAPNDGLGHLEIIIREAPAFLSDGGLLALETGATQHDYLVRVANQIGLVVLTRMRDFSGRPRMLFFQKLGLKA
jgi:release factor glutamine methyltransferase